MNVDVLMISGALGTVCAALVVLWKAHVAALRGQIDDLKASNARRDSEIAKHLATIQAYAAELGTLKRRLNGVRHDA